MVQRNSTWHSRSRHVQRFPWLHDGHVVWRHSFNLDPLCRTVNVIHSHFATLRKVAHNQNFSLSISLCRKKLVPKFPKSWFCKELENSPLRNKTILNLAFDKTEQNSSKSNQHSPFNQHPRSNQHSSIHQHPCSNQLSFNKLHLRNYYR